MADSYFASWDQVATNKVVGALWPTTTTDRRSQDFHRLADKRGYKVVDPGRFDLPPGNYNAQIAAFKAAGAEIVAGVLPPPEYTAFTSAPRSRFRPKVVAMAKATEFPAAIAPLGAAPKGFR